MAGTEFQAEKLNIAFVNPKSRAGLLTRAEEVELKKKQNEKRGLVRIPRRPKWTTTMTAEDLQTEENKEFLEWRRSLAMLQEQDGLLLTPYEKNLEFWRQLWRVVERSDVIAQIVDARNPLLFWCEDLEKYVREVDPTKQNMILLNKSDFLTEEQRKSWWNYFKEKGLKAAFFSATAATEELNPINEVDEEEEEKEKSDSEQESSEEEDKKIGLEVKETVEEISKLRIDSQEKEPNEWDVLSRTQLIDFFKSIKVEKPHTEGISTIGLVGYPNVGKSSTINAVLTEKKVSVSATPGKTKHFQTLYVDDKLMLCDCPGLVMPSFVATKADMILNGILPIDQMRDHVPPVNLLCEYIPRHHLEDQYGIMIAKPLEGEEPGRPPHSEELLLAHAYVRGFMTANGQPDQSRSARYVLKDFVNGKLLHCHAPPGHEQTDFHTFPVRQKEEHDISNLPPRQQRAMRMDKSQAIAIDKEFFTAAQPKAYIKGRSNFPNIRSTSSLTVSSQMSSYCGSVNGSMVSLAGAGEKPWKNRKKEKREKLRKKYAYLDEH